MIKYQIHFKCRNCGLLVRMEDIFKYRIMDNFELGCVISHHEKNARHHHCAGNTDIIGVVEIAAIICHGESK